MITKEQRDAIREEVNTSIRLDEHGSHATEMIALLGALDEMEREVVRLKAVENAVRRWHDVHRDPVNVRARVDYDCALGNILQVIDPDHYKDSGEPVE